MPALQVRLGDDEYAKCKEAAKLAGVSVSEWVRGRLFDGDESSRLPGSRKPRPLPPRIPVNAQEVIAAPAREVPLPPAVRRPRGPTVLSVAEKMAAEPPRGTSSTATFIDEVFPDDAALNALPDEPPDILADKIEQAAAVLATQDPPNVTSYPRRRAPDDAPINFSGHSEGPNFAYFPDIPCPPPAILPEPARNPRPVFKRAAACTSDKCERLQTATCDACKYANAVEATGEIYLGGEPVVIPPWSGRSPACITSKCERLGAPACDPCRRFNAAIGVLSQ